SEIFAQGIRSKAGSIATATNWVSNFVVSVTFLTMAQHITASGTFWFYAGILSIGLCFVFVVVPETKGLKLEDVQKLFTASGVPFFARGLRALAKPNDSTDDDDSIRDAAEFSDTAATTTNAPATVARHVRRSSGRSVSSGTSTGHVTR
ncbi:hypothetical protein GGI23_006411, partial [Coemansia sp. RSA 2559]